MVSNSLLLTKSTGDFKLSAGKSLKIIFDVRSVCDFWHTTQEPNELSDTAVKKFLLTYLCE